MLTCKRATRRVVCPTGESAAVFVDDSRESEGKAGISVDIGDIGCRCGRICNGSQRTASSFGSKTICERRAVGSGDSLQQARGVGKVQRSTVAIENTGQEAA